MQLAHAADDGLAGLLVELDGEGRVLFGELLDRGAQLLLVGLGLRLDGDLDDRVREVHGLEDDRAIGGAEGVTGGGVLQTDDGEDVARAGLFDRVLLVGVHLEDLADALLLALGGVEHLVARLGAARVDADVGELAEERVSGDLERQSREGLVSGGLASDDLVRVVDVVALDLADVERVRQEVDDGVEQGLHALVLVGGAAVDRVDLGVDGHLADRALDLLDGEFLATEELLHELVVGLGDRLEKLLAVLRGLLLQIRRDLLDGGLGADLGLAAPGEGLHLEKVDDAVEVILGADRELHDQRLRTEAVDDGADRVVEVGAELVHLVDEADTRDVVLGGLTPDLLGLRLHAFLAVEDGDCAIEDTEGALDLDGEVDVARGVDDVDLVLVPETGDGGRRDRDAALLLLLHPVGGGGTIVGLADLAVDARVVEDALGRGGLTGIDVGHDADVADLVQVLKHFLCHSLTPTCRSQTPGADMPQTPSVDSSRSILPLIGRTGISGKNSSRHPALRHPMITQVATLRGLPLNTPKAQRRVAS